MNDPNGFSMFKGVYHLFFQYNPYHTHWGPMHWGHYITKDFIQWELKPCALAPDMEYDKGGCFSGTALEWNGQHILMYTSVSENLGQNGESIIRQTQSIAFGDGVNYQKYKGNPVIKANQLPEGSSLVDFRDPKIWRDDKGFWSLVGSKDKNGCGQLALFYSENFTDWKFIKIFDESKDEYGEMWECPDFFSLNGRQILIVSSQFMKSDGKEFHNGNNSIYFVGDYEQDSMEWKRENPHIIDFGLDFYAPQTVLHEDGRRIMIGWLQNWDNYLLPNGYRWSGIMTVPRELELKNGRLVQNPVQELEKYRKNKFCYFNYELSSQNKRVELSGIKGRCLDLTISLKKQEFKNFNIYLAVGYKHETVIRYDKCRGILTTDRNRCGMYKDMLTERSIILEKEDMEHIQLRILLDKNSIELFVNQGKYVMSTLIYTPISSDGIFFETDGNAILDIEKYDIEVNKN
jgi:beta-fructofuranosidase